MSIELQLKRSHSDLDIQDVGNTKHQKLVNNPFEISELCSEIFSYIPARSKEWTNCTLVCQSWRKAITDSALLKQQLQQILSLTYKDIQNWQIICKNFYKRDLSMAEIIKECTNLKKLDLSHSSIEDAVFEDIISSVNDGLEEFHLKHCRQLTFANLNRLTSLQKIDVRRCPELITIRMNKLPSLTFLKICECMSLDLDRPDDLPDPLPANFEFCERVVIEPGLYSHTSSNSRGSFFTSHGFTGA